MYASNAKKSEFLVHLDHFSKFLKYFKYFEKRSKWTFRGIHNSLPSFWAKLSYSQIKIDHIADCLLKLHIEIGVHLINDELSQLPTPLRPIQYSDYLIKACFSQSCSKSTGLFKIFGFFGWLLQCTRHKVVQGHPKHVPSNMAMSVSYDKWAWLHL